MHHRLCWHVSQAHLNRYWIACEIGRMCAGRDTGFFVGPGQGEKGSQIQRIRKGGFCNDGVEKKQRSHCVTRGLILTRHYFFKKEMGHSTKCSTLMLEPVISWEHMQYFHWQQWVWNTDIEFGYGLKNNLEVTIIILFFELLIPLYNSLRYKNIKYFSDQVRLNGKLRTRCFPDLQENPYVLSL